MFTMNKLAYGFFEQLSDHDRAHCLRVEKLSKIIANSITQECINDEALSIAARFHDVGKILVPKCILNKPEALNSEERQEIMNHSIYSARFLTMSGLNDSIVKFALLHHENFDGTGYPFGISGLDIPIESRIIRVADVFDALSSERVYKKRIGNLACLAQMAHEIHKFDPRIVEVLAQHITDDAYLLRTKDLNHTVKGDII